MLDYRTHTFLAVYRRRSYTRAAADLHISQPAVSQHIRQLEQAYGCALFRKQGRAIEPTEAGELLHRHASASENDDHHLREEIAHLSEREAQSPSLRFGCTRTVGDYTAPRLIASYAAKHPDARIVMVSGNTQDLVEQIETGDTDFALVEGSFDRKRFDHEVLSRERFIVVGAPELAAGSRAPLSLSDLLEHRLILREAGSGTRKIMEKHLAARDLSTSDFAGVLELGTIAAIKTCAQGCAGITFIYRVAVERELAEGTLIDLTPHDLIIEHDFSLIWQKGSRYAARYRALADEWRGSS